MSPPIFHTKLSKPSLIRTTLINMGLRIAVVIIAVTLLSYWHIMSVLQTQTQEQLAKYVTERGLRESNIFLLAQDNMEVLKQQLLLRLQQMGDQDPQADFDHLFVRGPTGFIQNRPELFDGTKQAGIYIDKKVVLTPEIRRRMLAFYELAMVYGSAWHNRFQDTYLMAPENMIALYWPENPQWVQNAIMNNLYQPDEEYFLASDRQHNPARMTAWIGVFYEKISKMWMLTCVKPVDVEEKHIATVGQDIILNELFDRTIADHLQGTYNFIFREDGRLIIHPDYLDEIMKSQGNFNIAQARDPHLQRIFQLVTNGHADTVVVDNVIDAEYLAVTRLHGPHWYFVTVYPKSLLADLAFQTAKFIWLLGMLSLLIEILILFLVLQKQVIRPLQSFQTVIEQLANDDFTVQLDTSRQDELGQLAQMFNLMCTKIRMREQSLRNSEQQLRQFMEAMPVGVCVITREAKLFYLNRTGQRLLGLTKVPDYIADFQLSEVFNLYLAGTNQQYPHDQLAAIRAIRYGECTIRNDIEIHRHKDIIPVESHGTPIFDEAGNISHALIIFRDITERKQAEADRLQLVQERAAKQVALRYNQMVEAKNAELIRLGQEKEAINQKLIHSIQYAKVIQSSLLPNLECVKSYLPNSFLIWQPRDIVGGDMLYIEPMVNGLLIALLDCTGHGVPGAFMTMLASTHLQHIVKEHHQQPSDLLKRLNMLVKISLQQDTDHAQSDDGLDAAICLIQPRAQQLLFAGARLPLYYRHHDQIKMIKGDKQNLGYKRSDVHFKFTTHTLPLEPGMAFYLATDGFIDQLGGPKRLPLGNKRFQALLLECRQKPFADQALHLLSSFHEYRYGNERIDDVTVVGFTVK